MTGVPFLDGLTKLPVIASAFGLFTAILAAFTWAEDLVSKEYKQYISKVILDRKRYDDDYKYFIAIFDLMFGGRAFSIQRVAVVFILSFFAFWPILDKMLLYEATSNFPIFLSLLITRVVLVAFVSLMVVKSVSRLFFRMPMKLYWIALPVFDVFVKYVLASVVLMALKRLLSTELFFGPMGAYIVAQFSSLQLMTIMTWMYLISGLAIYKFANFINIQEKPVRSVGIVVSVFISVGYILTISSFDIFLLTQNVPIMQFFIYMIM